MKLKIRDKVIIAKSSVYYKENNAMNPHCKGTITKIDKPLTKFRINVLWDNGKNNDYNEEDLELLKQQTKSEMLSPIDLIKIVWGM